MPKHTKSKKKAAKKKKMPKEGYKGSRKPGTRGAPIGKSKNGGTA